MESAAIAAWHIERYDAVTANRSENGLMRPDRSQTLGQPVGTCGGAENADDDEAARSELQQLDTT